MRAQFGALILVVVVVVGAAAATSAHGEGPPVPNVAARVERRAIEKAGRVEVAAGATYLVRGDFYRNPGAVVSVGYWLREPLALELEAGLYAAVESDEAAAVRLRTGFLPDS